HFVVHVVPEDVEEQHVADQMHHSAVQKLIGEKLVQAGVARMKQKVFETLSFKKQHLRHKHQDIRQNQRVVHVRRSAKRSIGGEGNEHIAQDSVRRSGKDRTTLLHLLNSEHRILHV